MQVINWFQDASWEQQVLLGTSLYILQASWNTRGECWNVSLYTNENLPLFEGKRVNINIDLPGQVQINAMTCQACGAPINTNDISIVNGAPMVHCKSCGTSYQITEEPKW